jgi:transposase
MKKSKKDNRSTSREVLEAYRIRAIDLRYKKGYSVQEIADIFDIHYNSVSRWFCIHRKDGLKALYRTTAPGAQRLLDDSILQWLEEALCKEATEWGFSYPLWTVPMVRTLLQKEQSIKAHPVTVWRWLNDIGLSYQKPQKRYVEQNQELVEKWIRKEWPKIKAWVKKNRAILYFEDESGVSIAPVIGKTWAKKGKPPILRVTGKRGGVLAMSAISPSGRMRFCLQKKRVNSNVMIDFLEKIAKSHKRRKIAVVMDQAPCHISKKVQNYAENHKRLRIFYIPPYSPELNPDEKVWRHLKHVSLKNHSARTKNELTKVVLSALRSIQKRPDLASSFFENYLT